MPHPAGPVSRADVLIIGAGISGLMAARALAAAGHSLSLVDKGRGLGGRMASRRFQGGTFDHGAQFFTARDHQFQRQVQAAIHAGAVASWFSGAVSENGPSANLMDGHPRFCGKPAMTGFPKWLAQGFDTHLNCEIRHLDRQDDLWVARSAEGKTFEARALLLTCPVEQSLNLLTSGGLMLPAAVTTRLGEVSYDPCFAVLVQLDGPSNLAPPGACQPGMPLVHWIADNFQKGVSPLPGSVTIHTSGPWARANYERNQEEIGREVAHAAAPWLGGRAIAAIDVRRWRYAKATSTLPETCLPVPELGLCFAGDAFGAPRVEGAAVSGASAANALHAML